MHVDYGVPLPQVELAMRNEFKCVGYELVGIKTIAIQELLGEKQIKPFTNFSQYEKERLKDPEISNLYHEATEEIGAVWAIYELVEHIQESERKRKRFSLLHIKAEACAMFESLYCRMGINPVAVVFNNPGEGYGDNWTKLTNSEFRFYKLLRDNATIFHISMPELLLTNYLLPERLEEPYWPHYKFLKIERSSNNPLKNIRSYKYDY